MVYKVNVSHSNLPHTLYLYINLRKYFLHFIVFSEVAILKMTYNDLSISQKDI